MSCKFSQHDSNMNALQHSMAPPPNAHAPQPGMNYIRSGVQGGGHKDHRLSSQHHLQQRQPQHLQQQQYYNQHVPQPQQRYTQQPQQQQQSSHMMRLTSSGGYGAPSHGQQQQVHHHQQQRHQQQQQQPSYHHQQQQHHSQNHPSAQQQQQSQNHMVSNAMSYRDNTCRSQSPRPQPQVVRLPPINFEDETPSPDNGRYDNDRIQNDLLDEICSDIGIKDAIDLDMFDFDANAEHYVIQPTRLPDDLDSLDQTIPFSAMTKQEDLLVPDGAIEGLSNAPQYPQQSSHVKVSSTSAVPRSMTEESIASPTISSSSNSHKANVGSSRPSSVSSADSPAAVHSTTSSTGSSDKHEADARPDVDQCTSDDQKALMCPGFLQRLATASPHEGDVTSPSPRPADLKTEHPANKLPASPYNMANTCQTSVASSPYKTGDKPSISRSISRPQRSLSSPFDPGYFSIGSPSVCTANSQYEGSTNLPAAGSNCADDTNSKVMRFLNQVSGTESGPGVIPDGISTSGTCSALTSKSNSPTGAPAKRPRIISNGSDLLEEMRERYMFTKGANIYAKSPNSAMPPPVQRSRMYPSNQPSAATSPGLPQQHQQLSSCSMNSGEQQTFNFGQTATGFGGMSHNASYSQQQQQQQASQDMPPPPGLFPASCVGSMPRPASMQPPNPVAMQQPSSPACMGGGGPSGMYGSCPDLSPPRGQVYPQQQQQQQQQGYNSSQQQLPQPPCYASQGANSSQMLSTSSSSVPGSFSAPNTPSKHPQQPRPYNHTMAGGQMRQNLMRMYPTTPQHPQQQQQQQGGVGVMENQCLSGGVDISTDYHGQSHHMDPALHSPHLNGPMQTPVDMLPGNSTPSMQAGDPHLANLPSSSSSTSLSHGFMQHLINDRSSAFRSHPLFPLLRDLIIADMNFHSPSFPFALIANLPADFDRLLQNYLARNPPQPNQQNSDAVQGVIMDALKYAHSALIEKIQCRKVKEGYDGSDKPLCAIEDFCERFDRAVKNTMKPDRDVGGGMPPPPPNVTAMQPQHQHHSQAYPPYQRQPTSSVPQQPRHQYQQQQQQQQQQQPMMTPPSPYSHLDPFTFPGERRSQSLPPSPARKPLPHPFLQAGGGMAGGHMMAGSDFNIHMSAGKRSHDQTHSTGSGGKNKVLPKEAVQLMLDWLRQHQDNPYPNDDEKEMLINKTKLTINQINYWFTNARRRILPKWALQRYMEQQEKQKEVEKKKSQEADSPPPLVGSTKAS